MSVKIVLWVAVVARESQTEVKYFVCEEKAMLSVTEICMKQRIG